MHVLPGQAECHRFLDTRGFFHLPVVCRVSASSCFWGRGGGGGEGSGVSHVRMVCEKVATPASSNRFVGCGGLPSLPQGISNADALEMLSKRAECSRADVLHQLLSLDGVRDYLESTDKEDLRKMQEEGEKDSASGRAVVGLIGPICNEARLAVAALPEGVPFDRQLLHLG